MKFASFSSILPILVGSAFADEPDSTPVAKDNAFEPLFYPAYTQLSSTVSQVNGPIGTGTAITYDSVDAQNLIDFESGNSDIQFLGQSAYFALAAPQIGGTDVEGEMIADYWMRLNGEFVGNSNVQYKSETDHSDVIVCQGVAPFFPGDEFAIMGSGINSITEVIAEEGEPLVPSIIFSVFELPVPIYAQLSSTVTQPTGDLGVGTPLTYDSVDALAGLTFEPGSSVIGIQESGAYFIIAAPQVGGTDTSEEPLQIADYWVAVNGVNVGNSNVRYKAHVDDKDVIICQGVYELTAGDEVQVLGSGVNSVSEAIQPGTARAAGTVKGPKKVHNGREFVDITSKKDKKGHDFTTLAEPLVPSIIFSMFALRRGASYAQLSSTVTQHNGPLGSGVAIHFNSIDALDGVGFDNAVRDGVTIKTSGSFFIVAAPQVGAIDITGEQIADYWIRVNGVDVGNSNVRYESAGDHEDVIVCQGVYELSEGDFVQVIGSGENSQTEAIEEPGEPLVPSIIFSIFEL